MTRDDGHRHTGQDAIAFVTERELALRWKVSTRTLQRWRNERSGPAWTTIGGSVRYRLTDVLAFEAMMRRGGET